MRTIIINGIVISLMMFAILNGGEKNQNTTQSDAVTSKVTHTCLSHLASIIAQQKKQNAANAGGFEGTYHAPSTSLGSIEYKIHKKENEQLLIQAQVEVLRFGWFTPDILTTSFAKLSDDQGDKLRVALDDSFGRTLWERLTKSIDFEQKPDTFCRCRFFARGNKITTEQNYYLLDINIPRKALASYVQAAEQHYYAQHSLSQ